MFIVTVTIILAIDVEQVAIEELAFHFCSDAHLFRVGIDPLSPTQLGLGFSLARNHGGDARGMLAAEKTALVRFGDSASPLEGEGPTCAPQCLDRGSLARAMVAWHLFV